MLVFWQLCNFDFVNYDDNLYVYENPHVLNGLTPDAVAWAFTSGHVSNWHPLTWLSLMLDCQLFGTNAGSMHLTNLFLHLINTLLLFAVLKTMTGSLWSSAFVAAAFAIHPMHVESVAWIAERKDVLSTLFGLLTLAAYIRYIRRRGLVRYLLTVLLFSAGLLAKPMLVTLPFLLLLLDYWPLGRFDPRKPLKVSSGRKLQPSPAQNEYQTLYDAIIEKIPFFALSLVSSVITFLVQRRGGAIADINLVSLQDRIANAFLSYARYIGKMFWPDNLAVFYPFDLERVSFWLIAMCVMLLLGISIFVIRLGRIQKYLLVGWFWFIITLVPVIGMVQVGEQAYADRYTYIPYIGLYIMIAWGLPEVLSNWPQRKIALGLSMVIALTILGICAHRQVSYWNNSMALFSRAIEVNPDNYLAHNQRGIVYSKLGRWQDALGAFKQAIKIKPDDVEACNNLGTVYIKLNRWQEAIDTCKQAIRIKPNFAEAHFNLGIVYDNLGRWQEALEAYKQAIIIKPDYAEMYNNLGVIYCKLGRYEEAIDSCNQAIRIKPDYAEAHNVLGVIYGTLSRYQEAIEEFGLAIKIKPDYTEAHNNLGAIFYKLGRWQEAIEAYKQAIKIKPDYAEAHMNLGVAYFVSGDKESALEEYKILQTLDTRQANKLFNMMSK